AFAVNVIEPVGLSVVGLKIVVRDRPCRRHAAEVTKLAEILPSQSEQRRAVELGIAAHIIVRMRVKLAAVGVAPLFFCLILAFEVDGPGVPVVLFARHIVAALQNKDALAGRSELVGQRPATGACPDDYPVVTIAARHTYTSRFQSPVSA